LLILMELPLLAKILATLPEHLSSLRVFSGVRFLCSVLYIIVCPFVLFLLAIVLSVFLTASGYPIGSFKPFNNKYNQELSNYIECCYSKAT